MIYCTNLIWNIRWGWRARNEELGGNEMSADEGEKLEKVAEKIKLIFYLSISITY